MFGLQEESTSGIKLFWGGMNQDPQNSMTSNQTVHALRAKDSSNVDIKRVKPTFNQLAFWSSRKIYFQHAFRRIQSTATERKKEFMVPGRWRASWTWYCFLPSGPLRGHSSLLSESKIFNVDKINLPRTQS